jgi:flagellar assembly protein FliH
MTAQVVLRQAHLHEAPAAVGRPRATAATIEAGAEVAPDPLLAAREAAWQQGLAEGRAAGFRQGHAEGHDAGTAEAAVAARALQAEAVAQATAVLDERHRELADVLLSARGALQDRLARAEDEMVALCFETVARVLGSALVTPEGVRAQLRQLLQQAGQERAVAVHVHPGLAAPLQALCGDGGGVEIVADPAVGGGGCILRGDCGALDARLGTLLHELAALFSPAGAQT